MFFQTGRSHRTKIIFQLLLLAFSNIDYHHSRSIFHLHYHHHEIAMRNHLHLSYPTYVMKSFICLLLSLVYVLYQFLCFSCQTSAAFEFLLVCNEKIIEIEHHFLLFIPVILVQNHLPIFRPLKMKKVKIVLLPTNIVHLTIVFIHLRSKPKAHDLTTSLFPGNHLHILLFYVVRAKLVSRNKIDVGL